MRWKLTKSNKPSVKKAVTCLPEKNNELLTPNSTVNGDVDVEGEASVPGRDPDFGTSTSIKTFYEGKGSGNGHYNWVETPPKQTNPKVVKTNNRSAIKIYKVCSKFLRRCTCLGLAGCRCFLPFHAPK